MKRLFVSAICFIAVFANLEAHENEQLSGKLVKRYYPAPRIVKNGAFGWYLELDRASQEQIQK